ncbi:FAD-dependent oxidoreductase [Spongiactinospora sp. 9N601]|uniref:FAD-dependent oxidoreductase n=1 Tax=Spongiactinospora sp. 9N601 TaxID=3375149 RepID=UPI00379DE51C
MKVLIAGAGLGGLCLAQGLRRAGFEVVVFERDASPYARGQGHRVHIDDRGEDALRACLPEPLFELFMRTRGQASERFMLISAAGERLAEVPVPELPGGGAVIRNGRAVSRLTLREIMSAGVEIRYGKGFERHTGEDGRVRAHFADGTSEAGDLLVGADGIGSAVRRSLLPHAEVIDMGLRWIGGKSPITAEIASAMPEGLATAFAAVTDMDPAMLVGYLRFESDPRATAAKLVPGLRLSDPGDYVMWAITMDKDRLAGAGADLPGPGPHGEGESVTRGRLTGAYGDLSGPELYREALKLTAGAHPTMRAIVERAWPEHTFYLTIGASAPVEPWEPGNVTLLGDALHAMPPARGSGANTALADAASLTRHLVAGLPIGGYESDLRERGFAAVRASAEAIESIARGIVPR